MLYSISSNTFTSSLLHSSAVSPAYYCGVWDFNCMSLAVELSSIVSQPCAYNCNLLTCNWLLLPSDWSCSPPLIWRLWIQLLLTVLMSTLALPSSVVRLCFFLFFLRFCTLSSDLTFNKCFYLFKESYLLRTFLQTLTMHQQFAARMKNQSRGIFMFNNLDRAENLAFHSSSYDLFVFQYM